MSRQSLKNVMMEIQSAGTDVTSSALLSQDTYVEELIEVQGVLDQEEMEATEEMAVTEVTEEMEVMAVTEAMTVKNKLFLNVETQDLNQVIEKDVMMETSSTEMDVTSGALKKLALNV